MQDISTNTVEMTSFHEQKIRQALEDLDTHKFPSARALTTLNWISKQEARSTQQLLSQ